MFEEKESNCAQDLKQRKEDERNKENDKSTEQDNTELKIGVQ